MHRTNKFVFILNLTFLVVFISGCKKNWLDVNFNPRDLTDKNTTADVILPPILERCATASSTWYLQHWMGYWSHWSLNQNFNLLTYNNIQTGIGSSHIGQYINTTPEPEIFYLENKARESQQLFYLGIAKVVRALRWSQSVDVVNNMPYTEAYNSNILQPRYDEGKMIYEDLMKQLDSAVSLIKNASGFQSLNITDADIMFHGDKIKWVKFINTLKLRLLIHQANRSDRQSYIATEIAKINTEGTGFLQSGEDAAVNPGYSKANFNFSKYFGTFSSHNFQYGGSFYDATFQFSSPDLAHANLYVLELLKADADPRIGLFFSNIDIPFSPGDPEPYPQSDPQEYRGNKFGFYSDPLVYPIKTACTYQQWAVHGNATEVTATAQGIIKGYNMADWVLTSVESLFLQAEAIQRGWIPGDAALAYKDAVQESFRWLNAGGNSLDPSASDDVFNAWYDAQVTADNPRVSWDAAPDKYKLLMFQKYMAFNGIEPLEIWTDYRRNGRFPNLPTSVAPTRVANTIPLRALYNENEYIVNPVNAAAQGTINIFTSKIWWMP